ncbi:MULTISPECIES: SDR family oxidoreductase [unclassified Ochrobactrum]|uniref:SDR family oxidoreductase n=1 Tax=unclassified Ochrobactrum TaxID=239106 RepID=UPI0015FD905A|nr:nucleoside-diphosphate-sugar epimerase [Ochrobactrum sp. RH2CCR150]MDH7785777.1 nucleoside-diphosphate-sugar epimerase [Ochrobactrum sp. 19YEA23]
MRVFLTGATGFIGSRILPELLAAGHEVIGLTRSKAGANALATAGASAHIGRLEDPAGLADGARNADAVIHTAFDHNFTNFVANCEKDRLVIAALGSVLKGSNRPLLITSGVGIGDPGDGQPAREDVFDAHHFNPRIASELAGQTLLEAGVNLSVVRLPQVHDTVKQGLISPYIEMSREKGVVAYVGQGDNRWAAGHVLDVAKLYVLAIERADAGARYHAVAEEGVAARDIAEVVAAGLSLPIVSLSAEEASPHFGWFAMFAAADIVASSAQTREKLSWAPTGPSLLEDLRQMDYSAKKA